MTNPRSGILAVVMSSALVVGTLGCAPQEAPPDGGEVEEVDGGSDAGHHSLLPEAPTYLQADGALAQAVRLSWSAPPSPSSNPILRYTVTVRPSNQTVTTVGPVTALTIPGLTSGTPYTFVVRATNAYGDGPDSAPSASFTPAAGLSLTPLSACAGTGKITLNPPAVAGASAYHLYWKSTPGVNRLNGTKLANVTFPYVHDTGNAHGVEYHYVFTATDAQGVESIESNELAVNASTGVQDTAFAIGYSSNKITIHECFSNIADGGTHVTRTIEGNLTQLGATEYMNVFVDGASRRLYATTKSPAQVLVWNDAHSVDGNVAPSRTLSGAATGLVEPGGVVIDLGRDRMYVGDHAGAIRIWDNASTVNGDQAPTAVITGANTLIGGYVSQLSLDVARDHLYAVLLNKVLVFHGASALSGTQDVAPARTLELAGWNTRGGWYDAPHDRLFVGSRESGGAVYIFDQASTLTGTVTASRTVRGTLVTNAMQVQVVGNTLLMFNDSSKFFRIWDNADVVDGMTEPGRSVSSGLTNGSGFFYIR